MRTIEIFACVQKLPAPGVQVWRIVDDDIFKDFAEVSTISPDKLEFYGAGLRAPMQWASGYDMWFTDMWFVL